MGAKVWRFLFGSCRSCALKNIRHLLESSGCFLLSNEERDPSCLGYDYKGLYYTAILYGDCNRLL